MINLVQLSDSAKRIISGGKEYLSTKERQEEALRILDEMKEHVFPGSTFQGYFGIIRELYQQATGERVHREVLA